MPFDPNNPQNGQIVDADFLRSQFNSLKTLDDAKLAASEKGASNGVASLDGAGNVVQPANFATLTNKPVPVADGTYTVGIGTVQNGTITVVGGIITGIQEASSTPPVTPVFVGSGFEDPPVNGDWFLHGTLGGKNTYRNGDSTRFCSCDVQVGRWYIGVDVWPNQGGQSYYLDTPNDPPIGANWSSLWWLNPGTTTPA